MNNNNLKGSWYLPDGDSFKEIKVIEVEGDIARAVGLNVPISELGTKYKRKEDLTDNPFASPIGLPKELVADDFVGQQPQSTAVFQESTEIAHSHNMSASSIAGSPEEEMLKAAIKLTKEKSTETLKLNVELSFDAAAIAKLLQNFEISSTIARNVLTPIIKADIEKAVSSQVVNNIINSMIITEESAESAE